jgi:polyisoprenoid-binding protein YceI
MRLSLIPVLSVLALLAIPTTIMAKPAAKALLVEAPSGKYVVDLSHASIVWKVNHMGLSNYVARFAKFDATLNFDAAKPELSTLLVTIDPTSVRTEYPDKATEDFDAVLAKDWFNAGKYAAITFASKRIVRTGASTADIIGDLSFLGVSKPITLKAIYNGSIKKHPYTGKSALGFSATGALKRSDFGLGKAIPVVGDEVRLHIEAEFNQPQ